jgi:hypothetical protein
VDHLRLRPGISHRSFDGCAIILDLDRDRYWQLSGRMGAALDRIAGGESAAIEPDDVFRLETMGLVERAGDGAPSRPAANLPPPTRSATEGRIAAGRIHPCEALEVAHLVLATRRRVRRRALRALLGQIERHRNMGPEKNRADPILLAQRFHRYRRFVPLSALCLPDTIAFLHFAARRGCFPHLVFGVEAWPFAAHCWAQAGDCILNDALDHARSFSPILVL